MKIVLLSETYRRPIGEPAETYWRPFGDLHARLETHRRPIGDPQRPRHAMSETDMSDRRPNGDQNAPSETDMPVETDRRPTSLRSPIRIQTHLFKYSYFYIIFAYLYWNNVRTLTRHVSL